MGRGFASCALAGMLAACRLEPPPPTVTSVQPAAVCGDAAVTLTITGDNFAAVVERVLDGAPRVTMPSVSLRAPGLEILISDDRDAGEPAVHWDWSRVLRAEVQQGLLAEAQYAVRVTNPDGSSGTLAAAFARTIAAGPLIGTVTPATVCNQGGVLTLQGANLQIGATVRLVDPNTGMTLEGTVTVENATRAQLRFGSNNFPRNRRLDLVITNPDGCAAFARRAVRSTGNQGNCP